MRPRGKKKKMSRRSFGFSAMFSESCLIIKSFKTGAFFLRENQMVVCIFKFWTFQKSEQRFLLTMNLPHSIRTCPFPVKLKNLSFSFIKTRGYCFSRKVYGVLQTAKTVTETEVRWGGFSSCENFCLFVFHSDGFSGWIRRGGKIKVNVGNRVNKWRKVLFASRKKKKKIQRRFCNFFCVELDPTCYKWHKYKKKLSRILFWCRFIFLIILNFD